MENEPGTQEENEIKAVKAIITGIIFMMVIVAIVISIRRNANPQTKEPEAAIACWSTESEARNLE